MCRFRSLCSLDLAEYSDRLLDPMMKPPVAKIVPRPMTVHGDTRVDPYFCLNGYTYLEQ
jgi:hypothetical protein